MYKINELAKLSGVSTRTLRYYHEIELLMPEIMDVNGYRLYGQRQVDQLQQILFFRELDLSLEEIKKIMRSPDYSKEQALESHLMTLLNKKEQIELLITNVTKTIGSIKGEKTMTNAEKFEGFKKEVIDNNEKNYGEEIRKKYSDETIDASNVKVRGMTQEQWRKSQELNATIIEKLGQAYKQGDPASELAQEMCELHKHWLCMFWPEGYYNKEAHIGLAQMYVADERFTAHYDAKIEGATQFLLDAIKIYARK